MSNYKQRWANRVFEGVSSYTQTTWPARGQERVQDLFCRAMTERIRQALPGTGVRHAVDLACGVGAWTERYLQWVDRVTALDINPSFLEQAKARVKSDTRRERVTFLKGDAARFDGFDGADFVAMGALLMYLSDREIDQVLTRIGNAQEPGNLLYVRCTISNPRGRRYETEGGVYRLLESYEAKFREKGYEKVLGEHSATVVVAHVLGRGSADRLGPRVEQVMRPILWKTSADSAYFNWLWRRR